MKKFLSLILAAMAVCSVFAFAGCKDNKCDDCNTTENVNVYTDSKDKEHELCPSCYAKRAADNILGGLLG